MMRYMLQESKEYKEYEKMFDSITAVSLSKNISPFSLDEQAIVASIREVHKDENEELKRGNIGPFTRTLVANLPMAVTTKGGKIVDMECKIRSRTMQNLISDDIITNIRHAGSLDSLDLEFEFGFDGNELSELHFADTGSYDRIKERSIAFIKANHQIQQAIIDNYCDGLAATVEYMKSKESLMDQWEQTTRALYLALGMPESFELSGTYKTTTDSIIYGTYGSDRKKTLNLKQKKAFGELQKIGKYLGWFDNAFHTKRFIQQMNAYNEAVDKIMSRILEGEHELGLDSKFFFLDNGDNLYDEVIEKSAYHEYYEDELELISNNTERISPYFREKYIWLWCGNGKKDYHVFSKYVAIDEPRMSPSCWPMISKVVMMDSSIRSLSKAERFIDKGWSEMWISLGSTSIVYTQQRIDELLQDEEIRVLTSVVNNPHEMTFNIPDIKESSNMFTLFWGTFGNFEDYQPIFLKQMDKLMNPWDVLCISLYTTPKDEQEGQEVVKRYNTPQNAIFIKNFFVKLGIPQEAIEVIVSYDHNSATIHIDAKIQENIRINRKGKEITISGGTIFHCVSSRRMKQVDLQECIDASGTSLKIADRIMEPGNPFSLYMITK